MPDTELFVTIDRYIDGLFAPEDEPLKAALAEAHAEGLPRIQVSPGQGKLLYLLAKLVGARRILEVGTLGRLLDDLVGARVASRRFHGHAGARSSPRQGRGQEPPPRQAAGAGRADRRTGAGEPADAGGARRRARSTLSIPLDADKVNYPNYYVNIMQMVRPGSLILADNVIRAGTVLDPQDDDPSAGAARDFNAMIAADPRLEAIVLQQVGIKGHDGLAIARVR